MPDQIKMLVGITGTDAERCAREILWERFNFHLLDFNDCQLDEWNSAFSITKDTDHVASVITDEHQARHIRACGGVMVHVGEPSGVAACDGDVITGADATHEITALLNTHGMNTREFVIQRDELKLTLIERFDEIETHIDIISSNLFSRTTAGRIDDAVANLARTLAVVKGFALAPA